MTEGIKERRVPPVLMFTEATPNPESLKFVTNRLIFRGTADFAERDWAEKWSPMATALFELPYVRGVYICDNFVTVTKEENYDWFELKLRLKQWIKKYLESGSLIIKDGFIEAQEEIRAKLRAEYEHSKDDAEIMIKIEELLEKHIKPGVAMDGGNIELQSFKDGVVTVIMEGSCSGCPSSTVTLKAGIESLLKREIPVVKEVIAAMGD